MTFSLFGNMEQIHEDNSKIFDQLVQDYEEEFSPITGKEKNHEGKYLLDSDWKFPNVGYYWKVNSKIVGFCIKDTCGSYSDIAEFYVIPAYRKSGIGREMAFEVFDQHHGPWQVRQIEGAELAKMFWRKIISDYTNGNYVELEIDDPTWGRVTCQRFSSRK